MWGNMMGWGGAAGFGLGHLLWWALVVIGLVLLVRSVPWGGPRDDGDRALRILQERYARGEIDKAEFDARKRDLA